MEEIIFPNQIRMIRRTRGKTMKEIAGILNVSLSAISKIEKGYRRIDEKQLEKISTFLNCPKESIFVYAKTSQPEVLQAWEKEQNRRHQINEKSGLKTLGAGLRYIRGEKMLTLWDVSHGAGLTLSVYHRIEMGQREVTESQFEKIAHALGYTGEALQIKIYELDMAGTLQDLKKTGKPGIFHPKGGYNDLPLKNISLSFERKIPLFTAGTSIQETYSLDMSATDDFYALRTEGLNIPAIFNRRNTVLIVSKKQLPADGDLAVVQGTDNAFALGRIEKDSRGALLFIHLSDNSATALQEDANVQKVVSIHF